MMIEAWELALMKQRQKILRLQVSAVNFGDKAIRECFRQDSSQAFISRFNFHIEELPAQRWRNMRTEFLINYKQEAAAAASAKRISLPLPR
jgi:hypothetical protein